MLPIPNYQHGEVHPQVLDSKAEDFRNVKSAGSIRQVERRLASPLHNPENHNFCWRLDFGVSSLPSDDFEPRRQSPNTRRNAYPFLPDPQAPRPRLGR